MDKEEENSAVLLQLERGSARVLPPVGDWHASLEPAVREDLRRQRTYRGDLVKDLLRALRYGRQHDDHQYMTNIMIITVSPTK